MIRQLSLTVMVWFRKAADQGQTKVLFAREKGFNCGRGVDQN